MSKFVNQRRSHGFTLLEVIIALAVLVIGVSAMACLAAVMLTRGRQSKYMNVASTLATEKLEDLNRWSMNAPTICVLPGDLFEGSLTAPVTNVNTCGGQTQSVNYFDDININFAGNGSCANAGNGCFSETVSTVNGGVTTYSTTSHSPSGEIPGNLDPLKIGKPVDSTTPPAGLMTFHRSWLIEANTPITGTRRITVLVTLQDQSVKPGVSFQMSLVRQ